MNWVDMLNNDYPESFFLFIQWHFRKIFVLSVKTQVIKVQRSHSYKNMKYILQYIL